MPRQSALAHVVRFLAAGLALLVACVARSATADLVTPGQVAVRVRMQIDWGPIAGHLARAVPSRDGDTWETLAARETDDAQWAATIRAMNGGAERPAPGAAPAWVPPRGMTAGSDAPWYSAYVDCAKFGRESDVSRTGFRRIDPAAPVTGLFGTVTLALLRHATPEDAALSHQVTRSAATDVLAGRTAKGLVASDSWQVTSTVPESSLVRQIEQFWKLDDVSAVQLRLTMLREVRSGGPGPSLPRPDTSDRWDRARSIAIVLAGILVLVAAVWWRRRRARLAK